MGRGEEEGHKPMGHLVAVTTGLDMGTYIPVGLTKTGSSSVEHGEVRVVE